MNKREKAIVDAWNRATLAQQIDNAKSLRNGGWNAQQRNSVPPLSVWKGMVNKTPAELKQWIEAGYPSLNSASSTSGIVPNKYQNAIIQGFRKGESMVVRAAPGAGKTSTIGMLHAHFPEGKTIMGTSVTKATVGLLAQKIGHKNTGTLHSICYRLLRDYLSSEGSMLQKETNKQKYWESCKSIARDIRAREKHDNPKFAPTAYQLQRAMVKLIDFARQTNTSPDVESLKRMAKIYGLEAYDCILSAIEPLLDDGEQVARYAGNIDYIDMLWLAVKWDLVKPTFDIVIVDEAQDMNYLQREICTRLYKDQLVAVGDDRQAIFLFSGADVYALEQLSDIEGIKEYPLSVTYRCDTEIVNATNVYCKDNLIIARPDAKRGRIRHLNLKELAKEADSDDMIVAPTNSALVDIAIQFISRNRPVIIADKTYGEGLKRLVERLEKEYGFDQFTFMLTQWLETVEAQYKEGSSTGNQAQIAHVRDQVRCITALCNHFKPTTASELCRRILQIFSLNKGGVELRTIHKAKGDEARRVYFAGQEAVLDVMESGEVSQAEKIQARNMMIVAISRAKEELVFVNM